MIRKSFHAISTSLAAAALLALGACDGADPPAEQPNAGERGDAPAAAGRAAGEDIGLAENYVPKRGNPRPAGGAPVVGPWDGSGRAYVANQKAGTVSVVDLASGRVDTIPAGKDPHHPYVTLDQRWVLVTTHHDDDFILAIDTEDADRARRIETGAGSAPLHLAQSPETGMIAVTLNGTGEVAILDPEGATLERKVAGIGKKPRDPGFVLGGRKLFVMPTSDTVIAVVDTESWAVRHIPRHPRGVHHDYSGVEHSGLDVSPDGRLVAATNPPAGEVVFIDAESEEIVGRVKGLPDPGNPSFLGTTGFLGTGNPEDGSVSITDTRDGQFRHVATVKTGAGANIPQVGPDGRVYATANDGSSVAVLDPERWRVVDRIEGLQGPHWIVFSPDGSRGYMTNASGSTLTVVDMADLSVIETIPVGDGPNGVMLRTPDVS